MTIGGLPFLLATSQQNPMRRATAPFRRERIDNEREPGEQSLDPDVWTRSQSSYHYGAGQVSQEPLETQAAVARFRYDRSAGVDVWTPGQLSLLNATVNKNPDVAATQVATSVGGSALHATGTVLEHVTMGGSVTAVTWGGASAITSLDTDGKDYYAATAVGIYSGALPSGAGSKLWDTGATCVARFVKSRLMAGIGASIYELVGGSPPTLPTALYTHPVSDWTWTDITEGPDGIYVAGYSGNNSTIYKITPTSDLSGLNPPVEVAALPRGEVVYALYGYLGSFIGVGTSKGFRVAQLDGSGNLTLGPLLFGGAVYSMLGLGEYLYVGSGSVPNGATSTGPGVYRVDLSAEIDQGRFAYAPDLTGGASGAVRGVTTCGSCIWFTVDGVGLFAQDTSHYVTQGWMFPGRIRMGTTVNKVWRSLDLTGSAPTDTQVQAFGSGTGVGDPVTDWYPMGSMTPASGDVTVGMTGALPQPAPQAHLAFRLDSDGDDTPVLTAYGVRALPAPARSRLIELPLLCFDTETTRNGRRTGQLGGSFLRRVAIEELEDSGSVIQYRDLTTGEARTVVIERVEFARISPPSRQSDGAGGVLTVTLRTVS